MVDPENRAAAGNKPTTFASKTSIWQCSQGELWRQRAVPHSWLSIAIVGASTIALTQAQPPAHKRSRRLQAPPPGPKPPAAPSPESVQKAGQALADVRKALGGDKLAALKTLVASGQTRRIRGNNLVPIEFEISIELPDKYVRVDEFPAEDTDPTSAGFNGDGLIQIPPPPAMPARARRPTPVGPRAPRRARLRVGPAGRGTGRSATQPHQRRRQLPAARLPAPPREAHRQGRAWRPGRASWRNDAGGWRCARRPRPGDGSAARASRLSQAGLCAPGPRTLRRLERVSAHVLLCGGRRGAARTGRRPRREGRGKLRAALLHQQPRRAFRSW